MKTFFATIFFFILFALSTDMAAQEDTCNAVVDLIIGQRSQVTLGLPNNIRETANISSNKVGVILDGGVFQILDDPVCADGYSW